MDMPADIVQILLQVPMVALFTWLVIRLIKMFQDREAARDEVRCEERKELTGVIANNTDAIRSLANVVQQQTAVTEDVASLVKAIRDDTQYTRVALDRHDELVRDRMAR